MMYCTACIQGNRNCHPRARPFHTLGVKCIVWHLLSLNPYVNYVFLFFLVFSSLSFVQIVRLRACSGLETVVEFTYGVGWCMRWHYVTLWCCQRCRQLSWCNSLKSASTLLRNHQESMARFGGSGTLVNTEVVMCLVAGRAHWRGW